MRDSGRKSNAYENAVVNLVEALTLRSRVGEPFEAVVTEVEHDDEREGTVMVREPAVEAPVTSTRRSRSARTSPSRWPRPTPPPGRCASPSDVVERAPILGRGWAGRATASPAGRGVEEGPGSTGRGGG